MGALTGKCSTSRHARTRVCATRPNNAPAWLSTGTDTQVARLCAIFVQVFNLTLAQTRPITARTRGATSSGAESREFVLYAHSHTTSYCVYTQNSVHTQE